MHQNMRLTQGLLTQHVMKRVSGYNTSNVSHSTRTNAQALIAQSQRTLLQPGFYGSRMLSSSQIGKNENGQRDNGQSAVEELSNSTSASSSQSVPNGNNLEVDNNGVNWSTSFHGLSQEAFPAEVSKILMDKLDPMDIEIKPDGLLYLPEIKYRRILNRAFSPGGWGLAPRSQSYTGAKSVSREYALVCLGRLVSIARGEQEYFDPNGVATALEGAKSNALMRCCKDLGVASELWDPRFIREFKKKYCVEVWATHATTNKKRKLWRRKDDEPFTYPLKETPS